MNAPARAGDVRPAKSNGVPFIDCDVHPAMRSPADLMPYLSRQWRDHMSLFGNHSRETYQDTIVYPRFHPAISRADAWPPNGGPPGSDLAFMRAQHLDPLNVEFGILTPLATRAADQRRADYAAALCSALNDWQIATFMDPEPRLKASIIVPHEDGAAAVAEIHKRAADKRFVQVMLPPRSAEPLGQKRYWPIFEAALKHGLPLGLHVGGQGGHAVTGAGWPSYYFEEHQTNVQTMQAFIASMVIGGVFEAFPDLRVLLIEPGFAWVPALKWRLDNQWKRLRAEVPCLKRKPSEYVSERFWFTTQPIDEPERPQDLPTVLDWIGHDRMMFSSDYPHWDFDDPNVVIPQTLPKEVRDGIFRETARAFYRLPPAAAA